MNIMVIGRLNPTITCWFDSMSRSNVLLRTYVSPSVGFAELALKHISSCSAIIVTITMDDESLSNLVDRLDSLNRWDRELKISYVDDHGYLRIRSGETWNKVYCGEDADIVGVSLGLHLTNLKKTNDMVPRYSGLIATDSRQRSEQVNAGMASMEILTPRQKEVLKLVNMGKSNKEIARELVVTEGTVKVHCKAIFRALGVSNRTQAAVYSSSNAGP